MSESITGLPLEMVGKDGNAFAIIGRALDVMRKNKLSIEQIKKFQTEVTAGDYNHLLHTCMTWFDVD